MTDEQASIPLDAAAAHAVHYKWVVLGVLTLAHLVTSNSALSIQPLAPFLQQDLHLRNVHIGLMTSAFYLGAMVLSVPLGWFVDRFGVLWVLVGSQVVVGIFILAVSRAHSFEMILLFLVLGGIGYSGINPSSGKAIMCWFPWRGGRPP
jgi:MFS family permease